MAPAFPVTLVKATLDLRLDPHARQAALTGGSRPVKQGVG